MAYCDSCKIKIRKNKTGFCRPCFYLEKKKPVNCLDCGNIKKHRGRSKTLCESCYRKKQWKVNLELNNKKSREYRRKSKGIPLDHPNMRDGSMGSLCKTMGYKSVVCHGHPNAMGKKGRILEHVMIMSNYLGRPIKKGETIHHLNGIRNDNRIENLELWDSSHPSGQRVEDKIKFYKEFLEFHGYTVS